MILSVALIYIGKVIAGLALTHLIWDSRDPKHLVFKLFLGTGVGLGISSLLYFGWSWLGFPGLGYPAFELSLCFILLAINFVKEYKRKNSVTIAPWRKPEVRAVLWVVLALLAVTLASFSFWLYAAKNPHGYNDAWTIWNLAARFIYLSGDHWLSLLPKNAWFHADYPLMLSLNIAEGWSIVGVNSTRIPIFIAFLFVISIIGLLFSALAIAKDIQQAALAAILVASLPQLPFLGSWQYADLPLAYFFLATGALFYLYTLTGETRLIVLSGLFAALSAWTKNEGLMFAIISLCVCLILSIREKKNLLKYFAWGSFFPALMIVLFKMLTPPNDLFVDKAKSILQLFDPLRYQIIFSKTIAFVFSFGGWPISFALVLLLYILFVSAKPESKGKLWLPALLCLCQLIGYFGIYLITPHQINTHIDTSLDRLLFHLFPLAIFLLFNVLPSPQALFSNKLPAPENSAVLPAGDKPHL